MSNVVLLSDLDGTMLPARHLKVSDNNIRALRDLGDSGTTRVVVTGRNGQSTRAILGTSSVTSLDECLILRAFDSSVIRVSLQDPISPSTIWCLVLVPV